MRGTVKAPLRPFEYMGWAQTVPLGARYDLSRSGMPDTVSLDDGDPTWDSELPMRELCRRDVAVEAYDALVGAVARRYGTEPSAVTATMGASLAITHVLLALVRAGDHVVVERPAYEALVRVPEMLGAHVSRLERKFDERWSVVPDRLARLLTPRTRAVVLSNLHNPSGVALDENNLRTVADLAARVGATVLVDEVYLDFVLGPQAGPAASRPACLVAHNAVSWSSCTKAMGFGALRVGWLVTQDPGLSRAIRAATDFLHVGFPVASARLGCAVLEKADALTVRAQEAAALGRRVLLRWLESEPRIGWVPPAGGLCCAIRLPSLISDTQFAEHLRARYDTQVVPGSLFEAPGFVRLGFGHKPKHLEQALSNFSAALDDLT